MRSDVPDVKRLRNNLEEGSGEKDIIFKKCGCVCKEKNVESRICKNEEFCFKVLSVLTCCLEEGLSEGGKVESAKWGLVMKQALESGRGWH